MFKRELPQHKRYAEEERSLSDIETRAHAAASAECEVIPLVRVVESRALLRPQEVVLVSVWIKVAWVWIPLRVVVQCPDVDHHSCLCGKAVVSVRVCICCSMRYDSKDTGGEESK